MENKALVFAGIAANVITTAIVAVYFYLPYQSKDEEQIKVPMNQTGEQLEQPIVPLPKIENKDADGNVIIDDPYDLLVIANKKRKLPDGFKPNDLVVPKVSFSYQGVEEKSHMRKEAAEALEKLFALGLKDGIQLRAVSGFRSMETQKTIFEYNIKTQGQYETERVSSKPGFSEHQTGLAIDVSADRVNNTLEENFGDTIEGQWLAKHAHEAGYIIRYLKGKEDVTGYAYEPWHIRYVGEETAKKIAERHITLEEYIGTP